MVGLATTAILTEARPTGMMVPGMPMAREAAPPLGTMAPGTLRDGGEAPLHGIMDRAALADSVVALLRGAAAPAAPRDGGVARPPGAAAPVRSTGLTGARARGDDDKTAAKRSWPTVLLAAKTYGKGFLNPPLSSVLARVRAAENGPGCGGVTEWSVIVMTGTSQPKSFRGSTEKRRFAR
jgi:hypothetical protein